MWLWGEDGFGGGGAFEGEAGAVEREEGRIMKEIEERLIRVCL